LLRSIAYIDIGNFEGKTKKKAKFDGNIEDQVVLWHEKNKLKSIPEAAPPAPPIISED